MTLSNIKERDFSKSHTFRAVDSFDTEITQYVKPGFKVFRLMVATNININWANVTPNHLEVMRYDDYNSFTHYDPNDLNKECNLPPNYFVVNSSENSNDSLLHQIKRFFKVEEVESDTNNEVVFKGTFRGWDNILENEFASVDTEEGDPNVRYVKDQVSQAKSSAIG